jgi:hypothetical protein
VFAGGMTQPGYAEGGYDDRSARGLGWAMFAAILLFLAGTWNVIQGVLGASKSHVYTTSAHYVFSDLRTWGWIVLALGVIQLCAGAGLLSGSSWAVWFAIAVAGVNAIGQLMFIPAYPVWALAMFTLDILIIYGLVLYHGTVRALRG